MSTLAPLLEAFFRDRLIDQRQASPNTVAAYRDAFRLLLVYAREHTGTEPSQLALQDLDAALIGGFLTWLETDRGQAPAPATRGSRPSGRSTATPRTRPRNTPP